MDDQEKLEEIRKTIKRIERDRARVLELVREVFPEKRGEPKIRGRLTEVTEATGWTREHVANVRDGKVQG